MRDLSTIRIDRLRIAAASNGWRRVDMFDPDGSASVDWQGPDDRHLVTEVPELLPAPLCQAIWAQLISCFEGVCPVCGARRRALGEDELATVDHRYVHLLTDAHVLDVGDAGLPPTFTGDWAAIQHDAECDIRPEHVKQLRKQLLNP